MSRRQKKEAKVDEEFGDFFGETVDGNQKSDDVEVGGFFPIIYWVLYIQTVVVWDF